MLGPSSLCSLEALGTVWAHSPQPPVRKGKAPSSKKPWAGGHEGPPGRSSWTPCSLGSPRSRQVCPGLTRPRMSFPNCLRPRQPTRPGEAASSPPWACSSHRLRGRIHLVTWPLTFGPRCPPALTQRHSASLCARVGACVRAYMCTPGAWLSRPRGPGWGPWGFSARTLPGPQAGGCWMWQRGGPAGGSQRLPGASALAPLL